MTRITELLKFAHRPELIEIGPKSNVDYLKERRNLLYSTLPLLGLSLLGARFGKGDFSIISASLGCHGAALTAIYSGVYLSDVRSVLNGSEKDLIQRDLRALKRALEYPKN